MSISVIVPTWRRPASLERTLLSLEGQDHRSFEVIVVDNDADDAVASRVRRIADRGRLRLSYVAEPQLGLHHARHRGATVAVSELLVFTDDDATFSPGWLSAYEVAFSRNAAMAAASGPVTAVWACEPPPWLARYVERGLRRTGMLPALSLLDRGAHFRIAPDEVLFGVNMAIRRSELTAHGGFSPEIFGRMWLGDGESGLSRRLAETGRLIGYVPDALAHHHVDETRTSLSYLRRRMMNEGAVHAYAKLQGAPLSRLRLAAFLARTVAAHGPVVLAGAAALGRTGRHALRVQLAAANRFGRIRYAWWLLTDSRLRALVATPPSHRDPAPVSAGRP